MLGELKDTLSSSPHSRKWISITYIGVEELAFRTGHHHLLV